MGIAGLKIERTQVRLAATRLLFNILLQCKRQYLLASFGTNKDNRDSDSINKNKEKIDKLVKQMIVIGKTLSNHLNKETHEPSSLVYILYISILKV